MKNNIYYGDFDDRQDLERYFDVKLDDNIEILFADYETGDYDGHAIVICRRESNLFMIEAWHCSCYGLEGQWREEEIKLETLKYMFDNGKIFHFEDTSMREHLQKILEI